MIKCKQSKYAPCGKVICCFTCEEFEKCEDICATVDDISSYKECHNAEELAEEIDLKKQIPDVVNVITDICIQKKKLDEQEKAMRQKLLDAMEQYGVKKFENEQVTFTYIAPTTRSSIDSAKLKKEQPDIVKQYSKTSNVSASVKITVK